MKRKPIGKLLLLPFLLALPLSAQTPDMQTAKSFVQQVYLDYANPDTNHQDERQAKFYSPGLHRLILADRRRHPGEAPDLDFDPICNCQDPGDPGQLKVQTIKLAIAGPNAIKALVNFTIVTEPREATLSLLRTASGWHIDDIGTKDVPSLRAFLTRK